MISDDDAGSRGRNARRKCRLTPTHRRRLLQQPQPRPPRGSKHSPQQGVGRTPARGRHRKSGGNFSGSPSSPPGPTTLQTRSTGTTPQPFQIETIGPGELSTARSSPAVEMFRDAGLEDGVIRKRFNGGEVTRKEFAAAKALKICSAWRRGLA